MITNEKLVSSAKMVGKYLIEALNCLMKKYISIGQVRGMGLCIGVELVCGRPNMKPATQFAEQFLIRLVGFVYFHPYFHCLQKGCFSTEWERKRWSWLFKDLHETLFWLLPLFASLWRTLENWLNPLTDQLDYWKKSHNSAENPALPQGILNFPHLIDVFNAVHSS